VYCYNVGVSVVGSWIPGLDAQPLRFLYSSMAFNLSLSFDASIKFFGTFRNIQVS
jgi:hypothetical protein